MPKITVTQATADLIAAHAQGNFTPDGLPAGPGLVSFLVDDEVLGCLQAISKDLNEAIRIICSVGVGHA